MRGVTLGEAAFLAWVLQLLAAPVSAQTYNFSPGCRLETILTIGSGIFGGTTKDCGEPGVNHAITPDTDGIPNPNNPAEAAARMEDVSPNVKKVTVSGRARQLLDGSFGDVTTTARFDAGFRPHVSPANAPSVVRVEADLSVNWSRGAVGAGGVSLGVGFECPGMPAPLGVGIGADATVSGAASTKQTVKCVITSGNPFGFLAQINISGTAAAGAQSGKAQDMSYAGTFTVSVVPAGKELKGVSGPLETVAGVPFAQPFVVNVFRNDTDAAVSGEPIVFNLKNAAGTVVQTKAGITGPDGAASMNFTVADPGDYKAEASCAGCVAGSPAVFSVSVKPLVLSLVLDNEGGDQSGSFVRGLVGQYAPRTFRVALQTNGLAKISEVPITFSVAQTPAGAKGHGVVPKTVPTSIDGRAFAFPIFGSKPGGYAFRAACESCTGTKEVSIALTADPVPTLIAALPAKSSSKIYVSIAGSKKVVLRSSGGVPIRLSATGGPGQGEFIWSIHKDARDKIRIVGSALRGEDGSARGEWVEVEAISTSFGFGDAIVGVIFVQGNQSEIATHKLTSQEAFCVSRSFSEAFRCGERSYPLSYGALYGYKYVVRDWNGSPLALPPGQLSSSLMFRHGPVELSNNKDSKLGRVVGESWTTTRIALREGVFGDVIGECKPWPIPDDFFWWTRRSVDFGSQTLLGEAVDYHPGNFIDQRTEPASPRPVSTLTGVECQ